VTSLLPQWLVQSAGIQEGKKKTPIPPPSGILNAARLGQELPETTSADASLPTEIPIPVFGEHGLLMDAKGPAPLDASMSHLETGGVFPRPQTAPVVGPPRRPPATAKRPPRGADSAGVIGGLHYALSTAMPASNTTPSEPSRAPQAVSEEAGGSEDVYEEMRRDLMAGYGGNNDLLRPGPAIRAALQGQ